MSHKKVVVLILSYNGKYLLDDSVSSYLNNNYNCFNVVVIDNGSLDGTKEYVEHKWPNVKVLRTDVNLKYSGGFNFGLRYAFNDQEADYVLISNNDVKADSQVIGSCVEVAEKDDKIAFVTGKVYYYDQPDTLQSVGKKADPIYWNAGHIGKNEKDTGQYEKIMELAWCDDVFWLVSKRIYEDIGGYDEEFAFQCEDFDWQARAKIAGYKIYYTPNAKIWHKDSITIGKRSAFKAYYDARNPLIVHMKYRNPDEFRRVFRKRFYGLIVLTIKYLFKMKMLHIIKNWQGFVSAIIWGLKNHRFTIHHM
jgi:GT2 family glycosyltransferase